MSGNPGDFTFSSGLPYDEEPSAPSGKPSNPMLDFALDDYPRQRSGRDRSHEERTEPEERPANLYRESRWMRMSDRAGRKEEGERAELTLFAASFDS